ncbi:ABC transporter ATP-binding protein [Propioniciclava sinopodophylli]|uniref:ABC transporter ATP-binding protein n=1 Tax=Propioniciclava sinopodophylli TaxID=1837344 RepID=A0A4Q9KBN8_9ACTN|nr:ABC transporter ATP-binding protein [Propioniciclava sinopodophylli]TBT83314.1 ABC transporter ATP-binding protein [Propioniciclava sinopodophylli]
MSEVATEALATSAQTWREGPPPPRMPEGLRRPPRGRGWVTRLRDYAALNRVREEMASRTMAEARNPERGFPVSSGRTAVGFVGGLLRERRAVLAWAVVINLLASGAALVAPFLLGDLVDGVAGGTIGAGTLDATVTVIIVAIVVQAVLVLLARRASAVLGYDTLAAAREEVVRIVLRLPLGQVESSSSGDLLTRITSDVSKMAAAVRWALPHFIISMVTIVATLAAMLANSWLLALPLVVTALMMWFGGRHYLRRAPAGYITESRSYSVISATLTESIEGARTVEALGLCSHRRDQLDEDTELSGQAERYTLALRNVLFSMVDASFQLPLVGIVLVGTWGFNADLVTIGQITTAALYVQQLQGPLDRVIMVLDHLQIGLVSTTRLIGVAEVEDDRTPQDVVPAGTDLEGRDLRFAYREGHDVLHGVTLELAPGERVAVVGPSGSGKSTLGRLVAGINRPRTGSVEVGGVDVMDLPLDRLRTEVALVTQEHHVFVGSLRDNVVLARETTASDAEVEQALRVVDAWGWVGKLRDGLDTQLGHGHLQLTPAQAQQVALARLVVADPHTLVLDEATSLIDPTSARHLEGSMHALLDGRAVIAIAHRLHTAHDADRIAVVIDGRIAELGSHDELIDADGEYARLWRTWRS